MSSTAPLQRFFKIIIIIIYYESEGGERRAGGELGRVGFPFWSNRLAH